MSKMILRLKLISEVKLNMVYRNSCENWEIFTLGLLSASFLYFCGPESHRWTEHGKIRFKEKSLLLTEICNVLSKMLLAKNKARQSKAKKCVPLDCGHIFVD